MLRGTNFCAESSHFLDYNELENRTDEEIFFNPVLADMGDVTMFKSTGVPPAYRTIANEAFNSIKVAENHLNETVQTALFKNC